MTDNQTLQQNESLTKKVLRLIFILIFVNAVGAVGGGFMTPTSMKWYHTMSLSPLTPPDYVFAIVWPVLYMMMGISMFLVWHKASPRFFALQLMCTLLWPFVFFYMHHIGIALGVIVALIVFLGLTIKTFYPASKTAAVLLIPQFLWCLFAFYLNAHLLLG